MRQNNINTTSFPEGLSRGVLYCWWILVVVLVYVFPPSVSDFSLLHLTDRQNGSNSLLDIEIERKSSSSTVLVRTIATSTDDEPRGYHWFIYFSSVRSVMIRDKNIKLKSTMKHSKIYRHVSLKT